MREVNKKLAKFMQAKASKSHKNISAKGSATPHVTYEVCSPTTATSHRKANSRQFSMTLSFFNPKFDKPSSKDFIIRHEDLKQKLLASPTSARFSSPKRDPILQNNSEGVVEFKPCLKRLPISDRMAMFSEEQVFNAKKKGEYNPLIDTRSLSPRIEGIRTGLAPYRDPSQDVVRRQLKGVNNRHQIKANPITEGDIQGVKLINIRTPPDISDETKRLNDMKYTMASDRGCSRRGRV
jgi:hypothetical protein